jgi:hypothetical protein
MPFIYLISNVQVILRYISYINKLTYNSRYIGIFGLLEGKDVNTIPIQRERYGGIVHLFTINRAASYGVTFMPS